MALSKNILFDEPGSALLSGVEFIFCSPGHPGRFFWFLGACPFMLPGLSQTFFFCVFVSWCLGGSVLVVKLNQIYKRKLSGFLIDFISLLYSSSAILSFIFKSSISAILKSDSISFTRYSGSSSYKYLNSKL